MVKFLILFIQFFALIFLVAYFSTNSFLVTFEIKDLLYTFSSNLLLFFAILIIFFLYGINRMFNPKESVDFNGNTGPFIQYTYARIQAILRKSSPESQPEVPKSYVLHNKEKSLLKQLQLFPDVVQQAAANYSPALVANFSYDLVKEFNSFYQNVSILGADSAVEISFRVQLSKAVADTVKNAFSLLGIKVPERM